MGRHAEPVVFGLAVGSWRAAFRTRMSAHAHTQSRAGEFDEEEGEYDG